MNSIIVSMNTSVMKYDDSVIASLIRNENIALLDFKCIMYADFVAVTFDDCAYIIKDRYHGKNGKIDLEDCSELFKTYF